MPLRRAIAPPWTFSAGAGDQVPSRPRITPHQDTRDRGVTRSPAIDQPYAGLTIIVLPEDVRFSVAVGIGSTHDMPAGAWVAPNQCLVHHIGAVHQPDRRLAGIILPEDIG